MQNAVVDIVVQTAYQTFRRATDARIAWLKGELTDESRVFISIAVREAYFDLKKAGYPEEAERLYSVFRSYNKT
ncbi:hypothetical protein HY640_02125 [Candidatus Woesearchaeota archaeon]|nr:hypothetical protein [Candidatus Woesearchaeota archaeon]